MNATCAESFAKSFRTSVQNDNISRKTKYIRQFKSLNNAESSDPKDEANSFSSSNETAGSDSVIKPFRVNRNIVNINSSVGAKDNRKNLPVFRNFHADRESSNDDGCGLMKGFKLCKIPTCPTMADEE